MIDAAKFVTGTEPSKLALPLVLHTKRQWNASPHALRVPAVTEAFSKIFGKFFESAVHGAAEEAAKKPKQP